MGTQSDGNVEQELLTTFVTCEGDLSDPQFNTKFTKLLNQLQKLLLKGSEQHLGVVKVEPWNSVRVTFRVPKEGALRLRQLAQQRDVTLSQLGILSVQLEGDQAISLRIAGRISGESQEIVLRSTSVDTENISSQTTVHDTDRVISKSVVVSGSGSTASLIRTMTHVLSRSNVNQSPTEFKSPAISPSGSSTSAFTVPSKSSTTVISTAMKPVVPHSYHSSLVSSNSSLTVSPTQNLPVCMSNGSSTNNSSYRLYTSPPPYPSTRVTPLQFLKSNRTVHEETPKNPSPVNVALSSPLLVNLLQNDVNVPVNNNKILVTDKQKLKPSTDLNNMAIPSNAIRAKNESLETFANVKNLKSDSLAFIDLNFDPQLIQIQKSAASKSPIMVTNVPMPAESSISESVIVSSSKLPVINHLTMVTAKQNCTNQNSLVHKFQRQMNTIASSLPSQKVLMTSADLISKHLYNQVATDQADQPLTVGQNKKYDVTLINVPSLQQHLIHSQQLVQKPVGQQQWFQSSPQPVSIHQQSVATQKPSLLSQNVQGTKMSVSQNASTVVSSVMMTGNRFVNQIPQLLAQPTNLSDTILADRNGFSEIQGIANVVDTRVTNRTITENTPALSSKPDNTSLIPSSSNGITNSTLQLVKTFTFTNSDLSQNSMLTSNMSRTLAGVNSRLNPVLFSAVQNHEKTSNNISQKMTASVDSVYSSPVNYQTSVVSNCNETSLMDKHLEKNQIGDLHSVNLETPKVFQTSNTFFSQQPTQNQQSVLTHVNSTRLLNYPEETSNTIENTEVDVVQEASGISGEKEPQLLINPLTGEMEPMPETSDNESDNQIDVFKSLPSSGTNNEDSCFNFSPPDESNFIFSDSNEDANPSSKKDMDHGRMFSTEFTVTGDASNEKIKIRLKLPNKVDVLNLSTKKVDKPTSIVKPMPRVLTNSASSITSVQNVVVDTVVDEPRVPPLRLNLRGKNCFVKKNKKWSEDTSDSVAEDNINKKVYFGKNQMSPNDVISEKKCLSSNHLDVCKSVDSLEDTEEIRSKPMKKKPDDEVISEVASPYNLILSTVRTFPTEAEVTSILRSVPSDARNKMSLSTMKMKKKEAKKKTYARDQILSISTSVVDDNVDSFTRVINETKSTLSSQTKGKSKSNSSPLLKTMMKSSAAKGARFMTMMNRNSDKRIAVGETSGLNVRGNQASIGVPQRRPSSDSSFVATNSLLSAGRLNQKSSETLNISDYHMPNMSTADAMYGNVRLKEKKSIANIAVGRKMSNSKSTPKNEPRKEFHLNHESKKSGNQQSKKSAIDSERNQNVIVNCVQIESNPSFSDATSVITTNLDFSEKMVQQRLIKDSVGKPTRKKQRLDVAEASVINGLSTERKVPSSLINKKENNVTIGAGNESPSGVANEQTNNQGEDSGIESMDALSEKSLNQGESPCRKEDKDSSVIVGRANHSRNKRSPMDGYCDVANNGNTDNSIGRRDNCGKDNFKNMTIDRTDTAEPNTKNGGETGAYSSGNSDKNNERLETMSPDLDDVKPFRVTPALYTYSNPEKISRPDSPSSLLEGITDEILMSPEVAAPKQSKIFSPNTSTISSVRLKRKRKDSLDLMYVPTDKPKNSSVLNRYNRNNVAFAGKTLLEQLLIDIPSDGGVDSRRSGVSTRNTRSQLKGSSQPSPDTLSVCSTSSSSSIRTPKCSPIPRAENSCSKLSPKSSSRVTSRRYRRGSESSNFSISDESCPSGVNTKNLDGADLMKACIGFEDQNGKKIAVSALASTDSYRPIVNENSVVATSLNSINTSKLVVGRPPGKRFNTLANTFEVESTIKLVGKKRKAENDTIIPRRTNLSKSQQLSEMSLWQILHSETQEHQPDKFAGASITLRNSRVNVASAKTLTPSTSRRSVRQNHVTRRKKSPGGAKTISISNNAPNIVSSNNNNTVNKNNKFGKTGKKNEPSKNVVHEKNGVLLRGEKSDSANTTVRTRGHSTKQPLMISENLAELCRDGGGSTTVQASEEGINVRRKTRSVANSSVSKAEQSSKRRRNSKDGK